ncbi:collagen alpha-1(I) chain-like [Leopardus geoffroyi]|uniref:collagen alpha-1(I) chain-like n=1 Tax=Leopardus geoffroyi TaxID=46844 RepID=UPI001E264163|nr:collagen alpha-1(I) chain-like [Leopardus geoffroyi]
MVTFLSPAFYHLSPSPSLASPSLTPSQSPPAPSTFLHLSPVRAILSAGMLPLPSPTRLMPPILKDSDQCRFLRAPPSFSSIRTYHRTLDAHLGALIKLLLANCSALDPVYSPFTRRPRGGQISVCRRRLGAPSEVRQPETHDPPALPRLRPLPGVRESPARGRPPRPGPLARANPCPQRRGQGGRLREQGPGWGWGGTEHSPGEDKARRQPRLAPRGREREDAGARSPPGALAVRQRATGAWGPGGRGAGGASNFPGSPDLPLPSRMPSNLPKSNNKPQQLLGVTPLRLPLNPVFQGLRREAAVPDSPVAATGQTERLLAPFGERESEA